MQIKKWDMVELEFRGKTTGNPFTDYDIRAQFSSVKEDKQIAGFYDGNGVYKIRFMPSFEGIYTYTVTGSCFEDGESSESRRGTIEVLAPDGRNHGPVRVKDARYLVYEDGSPYHSMGTTCYAWVHQEESLQEQTLKSLAGSCFNKLRFCVFPKYYQYNENEPVMYPYERGRQAGIDKEKEKRLIHFTFQNEKEKLEIVDFDCYRPNTEYYRHLDYCVQKLADLGIEADIILFHPYDKWGFAAMGTECSELYLKYMAARYGAYHNVWWSMANEYDLFNRETAEWDAYGDIVSENDPYNHMLSIHNCMKFFDYRKDWITHCSMRRIDLYKHVEETEKYLETYGKPVVWDEIAYEGNIDMGWGNISGQEMVRRFWECVLRGGHPGHGETFVNPDNILWWSHGGVLHGESEPRIVFLKEIWDSVPGGQLKNAPGAFDEVVAVPADEEKKFNWQHCEWCSFEIHYYGFTRPSFKMLALPEDKEYRIDVIDTWNMTVTDAGIHSGMTRIDLPGREWTAIRLQIPQ